MDINYIGLFTILLGLVLVILAMFYHYWHPLLIERRLKRSLIGWQVKYPSDDEFYSYVLFSDHYRIRFILPDVGRLEVVEFSPAINSVTYRYLVYRTPTDVASGIYGGRGRFISREYQYHKGFQIEVYERLNFIASSHENLVMEISECCIVKDGNADFYVRLPQIGLGRVGRHALKVLHDIHLYESKE